MGKKDYLKDFIDSNRDSFDVYEAPKMNFGKLEITKESTSKSVKLVPLKTVLQIAAIAILFIGLGGAWLYRSNSSTPSVAILENNNESNDDFIELSEISDEMAELENYYVQQVNLKHKQLEGLGIDSEVNEELRALSEEFLSLQKELGEGTDNQAILEKMVNNYQLKLDFLEKIINNMNSVNETLPKNNKDESNYTIYY